MGKGEKKEKADGRRRSAEPEMDTAEGPPVQQTEREKSGEPKKELAELKRSEQLLRAVFDLAPDALFVKDPEGRYILVNPAAARFLDHSESQLIGKTDRDLWGDIEAVREVREKELEVLRTRTPLTYWRKGISDGMERFFLSTKVPLFDARGELAGVIGIGRELTERKLAEEALKKHQDTLETQVKERTAELESINVMLRQEIAERKRAEDEVRTGQEQLQDLYDNVSMGIYRTTPDGKVLAANPALIRMLGFSSFQELAARSLDSEVYEPDYPRKQFKELMEKNGLVIGLESRWTRIDNTPIYVRENARAVMGPEGRVQYYEGTVEDITEHIKLEQLMKEKARAELTGFIVSAIPVFAANTPPEARDKLIANFEERFKKNVWPNFEKEMARLWGPGVEDGCRDDPALMLEVFVTWIASMLSNFGFSAKMLSEKDRKLLEVESCPWKEQAMENPIFCAICRSMIISSFGWTCLKGEAKQTASHSEGADKCRFEFRAELGGSNKPAPIK